MIHFRCVRKTKTLHTEKKKGKALHPLWTDWWINLHFQVSSFCKNKVKKVHTYLHALNSLLELCLDWLSSLCMYKYLACTIQGFPGGSMVKNLSANAGDVSLIPGLGRCSGEGNGNSVQDSCLEDHMNRGIWRAAVHGTERVGWLNKQNQKFSIQRRLN